jgi:hypothetical protein
MLSMNKQFAFSFNKSAHPGLDVHKFPFKCVVSLSPLIEFWNQAMSSDQSVKGACARQIQDALQGAPELLEPIEDLSIIEKHRELVDMLMAMVFPPASWDRDYLAAVPPFSYEHFYATPSYQLLVPSADKMPRANLYQIWINRLLIRRRSPLSLILEKELVAFRSGTGIR